MLEGKESDNGGIVRVHVDPVQFRLNVLLAVVVASVIAGPVAVPPAMRVEVAGAEFIKPLSLTHWEMDVVAKGNR